MFEVASTFTLALALQFRVAYFLSGLLIAVVPLIVFGAVIVILFRAWRREELPKRRAQESKTDDRLP